MKNFNIISSKTLNILIFTFPLMFILGNFFINTFVFLFSIIGIVYYKNKLLYFKDQKLFILISLFFIIVLFSSFLEHVKNDENSNLVKSFLFLRYLILAFILRCMIANKDFNFKSFLFSCLIFSGFIAIDVLIQSILGSSLFGFKSDVWNSGMFDDEKIAGGFIQRFAILGFFFIILFFKNKNKKLFFISFLVLIIYFLSILASGNRMPALLFLVFLFFLPLLFIDKKITYRILIFSSLISIVLFLIIKSSEQIKVHEWSKRWGSFYAGIPKISKISTELKREYPELEKYKNTGINFVNIPEVKEFMLGYDLYDIFTGHQQLYITSIDIILDDLIIGRGIRSFRNTCKEKIHLPNRSCQSHPHHLYLDILNDTGILGFFIILILVLFLSLKNFNKNYKKINENLFFFAILASFLIEFFPIRSHGSFFSTSNAAFIFFLIGSVWGLNELKLKKFRKNRFSFNLKNLKS